MFLSRGGFYSLSESVQEKMLEELQKIRESVEPKPTPPPPPPTGFMGEFMDFLSKYGVIGLAIGFIIGGAAGALVSALVGDILMPLVTFFIPGGAWREALWVIGPIQLSIGHFIGALIDFIVIAIVVFLMMKQLAKTGLK
jgi:large conductance mechanosensitive channel